MQFSCLASFNVTGGLDWTWTGSDKAAYTLSSTKLVVAVATKVKKDLTFKAKLTVDTVASKTATTNFKALCAGVGYGWVRMAVSGDKGAAADKAAMDTLKTADEAKTCTPAYKCTQWTMFTVAKAKTEQAVPTALQTASARPYTASLFCSDTSGNFYASVAVPFTAKSNKGVATKCTYTFSKAGVDDVTNNPMILKMCCAIAEGLLVPVDRVTDAYGGYCGVKSKFLPSEKKKAPTTTTTNKTNTTNTTNKTNKTRIL